MTPLLGFFASVMRMRRLSVSWLFLYWLRRGYLDFGEVVFEHGALHVFFGLRRAREHDVQHFARQVLLAGLLARRSLLLLLVVRLLHACVQVLDVADYLVSRAYLVVGLAQLHRDVDLERLQVLPVVRVQPALLALAARLRRDGVDEAFEVGVALGGGVHAVDVEAVEGRVEEEDRDVRDGAQVDQVVDGGGHEARGESAEDW